MTQSLDITSIKDARIVEARELTSAAGRARLQKTQLEGEESIQWALEAHLLIEHIFYSAHVRQRAFLETLQAKGIACYAVSDGIMKKISDTTYLVPIIGIARLPPASERSGPAGDFVLVIDRVQDHGNLGTIIRTAWTSHSRKSSVPRVARRSRRNCMHFLQPMPPLPHSNNVAIRSWRPVPMRARSRLWPRSSTSPWPWW
jgi:small subunit rRNA (guanine(1370)-(2'-O))-methytransferase MRM3-like protein